MMKCEEMDDDLSSDGGASTASSDTESGSLSRGFDVSGGVGRGNVMVLPGGGSQQPLNIKEQVYQDKKNEILRKLEQLQQQTLPEYVQTVKQLDAERKANARIHEIKINAKVQDVEAQHRRVKANALKEFEELKEEARKNMLADIQERRRQLMREKEDVSIWNYHTREEKPKSTRSLRRRAHDTLPCDDKQKKTVASMVDYTVTPEELAEDMKAYVRKGRSVVAGNQFDTRALLDLPSSVRVEDDKLMYGDRPFYKGQNLVIETSDRGSVNVVIAAIDGRDSHVQFRRLGGDGAGSVLWDVALIDLEIGLYRIRK